MFQEKQNKRVNSSFFESLLHQTATMAEVIVKKRLTEDLKKKNEEVKTLLYNLSWKQVELVFKRKMLKHPMSPKSGKNEPDWDYERLTEIAGALPLHDVSEIAEMLLRFNETVLWEFTLEAFKAASPDLFEELYEFRQSPISK